MLTWLFLDNVQTINWTNDSLISFMNVHTVKSTWECKAHFRIMEFSCGTRKVIPSIHEPIKWDNTKQTTFLFLWASHTYRSISLMSYKMSKLPRARLCNHVGDYCSCALQYTHFFTRKTLKTIPLFQDFAKNQVWFWRGSVY